jgi:hypothetical protein
MCIIFTCIYIYMHIHMYSIFRAFLILVVLILRCGYYLINDYDNNDDYVFIYKQISTIFRIYMYMKIYSKYVYINMYVNIDIDLYKSAYTCAYILIHLYLFSLEFISDYSYSKPSYVLYIYAHMKSFIFIYAYIHTYTYVN